MNKDRNTHAVAVIGLGYVGLPLALLINKSGYDVIGIDKDKLRLEQIKNGISPITDESVSLDLKSLTLNATDNYSVLKQVEIIIICVPTPINKDFSPDYSFIISTSKSISKSLKKNHLIIVESTVNPGTIEDIIIPILEEGSKLKAGIDFHISHVPERINPGDKVWNVNNIPRVVGAINSKSLKKTMIFYESIINAKLFPLNSLKEAEAVKVVENCFRDINIAFVNELAMSFSHLGINLPNVLEGASTKPFSFLSHYPGCGVGGHCIPVDPYYLISYAKKNGFSYEFLLSARKINNEMPKFTVDQLMQSLKEIGLNKNKIKVCVLGLTYKQNINDIRESPSYKILDILKAKGISTCTYDPFITNGSLDTILNNAQAVIIATAHDEFVSIEPEYFIKKGVRIIVDGRNCLDYNKYKKSEILYKGIGC
jgi:UDP-N-acetyl-D-glucosamine dehydrogenase